MFKCAIPICCVVDVSSSLPACLVRPPTGYRVIVLDPPWLSKSVKRSKSYKQLDNATMAAKLPVKRLLPSLSNKAGCYQSKPSLVAVWVTNNPTFHSFVVDELFPVWGVKLCATWHWLKVRLVCQCKTCRPKCLGASETRLLIAAPLSFPCLPLAWLIAAGSENLTRRF